MNARSLFAPLLASATAVILITNTITGHMPPHIDQTAQVRYIFQCESPVASGSVADSYVGSLADYVNK